MMTELLISLVLLLVLLGIGFFSFLRQGSRWGATREELKLRMPGDAYLDGGSRNRVVMTRAISIDAEPETVWPWLAQLGRGAGWYSIDWLDNGGRQSARHIVSWIPEAQTGDATAIGYLRHIEHGKSLVWWSSGVRFGGAVARLATDILLTPEDSASRLVIRMSADARGVTAPVALIIFRFIDSIMARRQLIGVKERAEQQRARSADSGEPETGATDQYQLYEVIYASGKSAGVRGKEHSAKWRRLAIEDGVINA